MPLPMMPSETGHGIASNLAFCSDSGFGTRSFCCFYLYMKINIFFKQLTSQIIDHCSLTRTPNQPIQLLYDTFLLSESSFFRFGLSSKT